MIIETSQLIGLPNQNALNVFIDELMEKSAATDDPIFMSNLLINWEDTIPLVKALMGDEENDNKYILRVLCDEWGQTVNPGDKVKRKFKRSLMRDGKPIPSSTLNAWKNQGIYEQKRYFYTLYNVDGKGCIHVTGRDCEYFLRLYGIHSISGRRISQHLKATSEGKAKDPVDGKKKFVHYHRYKEMTKEMYEALPVLTKQDKGLAK